MEQRDWSTFTLRIPVKAGIQDVYDAWTSSAGIESWFLREAVFTAPGGGRKEQQQPIAKGDAYEWRWHGYPDEMTERGVITAANGKDQLSFSFGKAGNVSVTIRTVEQETVVELVQDSIPVDEASRFNYHIGCRSGWLFYLVNLKSLLEGGIDLRNRNSKLRETLNEVINS